MRALTIILLTLALCGCANGPQLGSIAGGESKVFEAPHYVVLGKTQHDQDWIDGNIVAGIAGFGWQRPQPRPPEWDNAPAPRPVVADKKQRVGIINRVRARVSGILHPKKSTLPLAPPMLPIAPVRVAPSPPPPAPEPIDPVDELLGTAHIIKR